MRNRKSFKNSKRRGRDDELREKKMKDPRKNKMDKDFFMFYELEEIDSQELSDDSVNCSEEEEDDY